MTHYHTRTNLRVVIVPRVPEQVERLDGLLRLEVVCDGTRVPRRGDRAHPRGPVAVDLDVGNDCAAHPHRQTLDVLAGRGERDVVDET
jgi:hypothetical protein